LTAHAGAARFNILSVKENGFDLYFSRFRTLAICSAKIALFPFRLGLPKNTITLTAIATPPDHVIMNALAFLRFSLLPKPSLHMSNPAIKIDLTILFKAI
jgi:hypothetical protein